MIKSRLLKTALFVLIILFTIDIGIRLFLSPTIVSAKKKMEYRVVLDKTNDFKAYEELLNRMAEQGWIFDHRRPKPGWHFAIFRK